MTDEQCKVFCQEIARTAEHAGIILEDFSPELNKVETQIEEQQLGHNVFMHSFGIPYCSNLSHEHSGSIKFSLFCFKD